MSEALVCDPAALTRLVRAGDREALEAITRCYGERLLAVGRRRCRDEEKAKDAVQDALISAGEHLTDFRGEGRLESWLAQMVVRACHRLRRGRKNDPNLHVTEDVLDPLAGDDENPEEATGRAQLAMRLGAALLKLSAADRALILLAEGEGWTGPELAEALGLTHDAVRARLTRIRRKLRNELADLRAALEEE